MSVRKAKRRVVDMMATTEVVTVRWAYRPDDPGTLRIMKGILSNATRAHTQLREALQNIEKAPNHAILIGHEVKTCNLMTWARWMEAQRKSLGEHGGTGLHVADEMVGIVRVSTVFLGLNHSFGHGPPMWFETMVFVRDSWGDADMDRYSTWEEAEAGHRAMVKRHTVTIYRGDDDR